MKYKIICFFDLRHIWCFIHTSIVRYSLLSLFISQPLSALSGAVNGVIPSEVDRDRLRDTLQNIDTDRTLRERKIQEQSIYRPDSAPEDAPEQIDKTIKL